jgi:hypothetical protein
MGQNQHGAEAHLPHKTKGFHLIPNLAKHGFVKKDQSSSTRYLPRLGEATAMGSAEFQQTIQ